MSPTATRNGCLYESKVNKFLVQVFGDKVDLQVKLTRGVADALARLTHPALIEIKLTQTPDAYYQLLRYAEDFATPTIRCVITKTVVRTIITPERPVYLPKLAELNNVGPGYYVIPFEARR